MFFVELNLPTAGGHITTELQSDLPLQDYYFNTSNYEKFKKNFVQEAVLRNLSERARGFTVKNYRRRTPFKNCSKTLNSHRRRCLQSTV